MIYSEKVMDHYANPRNVGEIEDANGVGEVGNAKCGDIMKMYLKIEDNTIKDVKFKTFGCGAAIATSSIATEMIKGKPLSEALKLTNKAVVEALDGLPPAKLHCSVLAEQAIKAAIADYYTRQGIDPTPFVGEIKDDHCDSCCGIRPHSYIITNSLAKPARLFQTVEKPTIIKSAPINISPTPLKTFSVPTRH